MQFTDLMTAMWVYLNMIGVLLIAYVELKY